jgi:hypothetical protein
MLKKIIAITLLILSSHSFSAERFGNVIFHSSVPKEQKVALARDLIYLFSSNQKFHYAALAANAGVSSTSGPMLYNWLVNRVRYIAGEDFLPPKHLISAGKINYPKTPLPITYSGFEDYANELINIDVEGMVVVMSNWSSGLYTSGKSVGMLRKLQFDQLLIPISSPRVGIVRIGEGLFVRRLQVNADTNSEANSISRLGAMIHEARHSDGSGLTTGFAHMYCPKGHVFEGNNSCDAMANGSYSLGAAAVLQLKNNCATCSSKDKTVLEAKILDLYIRTLGREPSEEFLTLSSRLYAHLRIINTYSSGRFKDISPKEMQALIEEVNSIRARLDNIRSHNPTLKKWNPEPEGRWNKITLEQSSAAMKAAIARMKK